MILQWLKEQPEEEQANIKKPGVKTARTNGKPKISKETNIGELVIEYPELGQVLAEDYGLHCVGCFASSFDTIEAGAQVHGMTEKEIDEMIERLNSVAKEE